MATFVASGRMLRPTEFGHVAVLSAQLIALGAVENFRHPGYTGSTAATEVILRPIPAYFQYVALSIACYIFYAAGILHAREDVQDEIIKGVEQGLQDLRFGGEQISLALAPDFAKDVDAYVKAQTLDYNQPPQGQANNSEICAVATQHLKRIRKLYPFISEDDLIPLEVESANITINLLNHIREELKVTLKQ